jgi:hypothetical protein
MLVARICMHRVRPFLLPAGRACQHLDHDRLSYLWQTGNSPTASRAFSTMEGLSAQRYNAASILRGLACALPAFM